MIFHLTIANSVIIYKRNANRVVRNSQLIEPTDGDCNFRLVGIYQATKRTRRVALRNCFKETNGFATLQQRRRYAAAF